MHMFVCMHTYSCPGLDHARPTHSLYSAALHEHLFLTKKRSSYINIGLDNLFLSQCNAREIRTAFPGGKASSHNTVLPS